MATQHNWDSYTNAFNYTCTKYNDGVSLVDILRYLCSNGHPNMELATLEGWVRENPSPITSRRGQTTTRKSYSFILPTPGSNQTAGQQLASSSSRDEALTNVNASMPPPSLPSTPWSAQADTYVMSAHRNGIDITTIANTLNNMGYTDATLNDVINSLTRQGVTAFNCSPR